MELKIHMYVLISIKHQQQRLENKYTSKIPR